MTGKFDGAIYKGDDTDETVVGTKFYETLFGLGGRDSLNGAGGNDVIFGGAGTDSLRGGTGDDTLFANDSYNPGIDGDKLYGEAGNDRIVSGAAPSSLPGGLIDGGADDDTAAIVASGYNYKTGAYDTVTFTLTATAAGSSVRIGSTNTLLVKNVEHLEFYGGFEKDVVTGGAASDLLSGGGGGDVLNGGAGDDFLDGGPGVLNLDGGSGFDLASVNLSDATDKLSLVAGGKIAIGAHGRLVGIEGFATVFTGSGDDTIAVGSVKTLPPGGGDATSYKSATYVDAGAGNDTVTGGNRQDTVYSGSGADRIDGGAGADRLFADSGRTSETIGQTSNDVLHGGDGNDLLTGGWGRDSLYGDAGDDTLTYQVYGRDGSVDVFDGGAGDDVLAINGTSGAATVELVLGPVTVLKLDGKAALTASSMEMLRFGNFSDAKITVTGGNLADTVTLNGASSDIVRTLGGDDAIYADGGTDDIDSGAGSDVVSVNIGGKDIVRTGMGDDRLSVSDRIDEPGSSAALYDAGAGTDTLTFSAVDGGSFDGTTVRHGSAIVGKIVNYEKLIYYGTSSGTTFAGTSHDDALYMGGGKDTASGGVGNDLIRGGADSDTLDGGVGIDTLDYGDKSGTYGGPPAPSLVITLNGGKWTKVVVSATETETDTVRNFENVVGGHGDDTITGTSGANILDGGGGADVLKGLGGADTFVFKMNYTLSLQPDPGITRIADFSSIDTMQLSLERFTDLKAVAGTGELMANQFKDLSKGKVDADDRILYDPKTGFLSYDADGNGPVSMAVHFATLDNKATLTSHDFLIA